MLFRSVSQSRYTVIGMKVFANIDDANKYAKEMGVGDYVEVRGWLCGIGPYNGVR